MSTSVSLTFLYIGLLSLGQSDISKGNSVLEQSYFSSSGVFFLPLGERQLNLPNEVLFRSELAVIVTCKSKNSFGGVLGLNWVYERFHLSVIDDALLFFDWHHGLWKKLLFRSRWSVILPTSKISQARTLYLAPSIHLFIEKYTHLGKQWTMNSQMMLGGTGYIYEGTTSSRSDIPSSFRQRQCFPAGTSLCLEQLNGFPNAAYELKIFADNFFSWRMFPQARLQPGIQVQGRFIELHDVVKVESRRSYSGFRGHYINSDVSLYIRLRTESLRGLVDVQTNISGSFRYTNGIESRTGVLVLLRFYPFAKGVL